MDLTEPVNIPCSNPITYIFISGHHTSTKSSLIRSEKKIAHFHDLSHAYTQEESTKLSGTLIKWSRNTFYLPCSTSLAHFLRSIDSKPFIGAFQMRRVLNATHCKWEHIWRFIAHTYCCGVIYSYSLFKEIGDAYWRW